MNCADEVPNASLQGRPLAGTDRQDLVTRSNGI
jgi:hypothetical protein